MAFVNEKKGMTLQVVFVRQRVLKDNLSFSRRSFPFPKNKALFFSGRGSILYLSQRSRTLHMGKLSKVFWSWQLVGSYLVSACREDVLVSVAVEISPLNMSATTLALFYPHWKNSSIQLPCQALVTTP